MALKTEIPVRENTENSEILHTGNVVNFVILKINDIFQFCLGTIIL